MDLGDGIPNFMQGVWQPFVVPTADIPLAAQAAPRSNVSIQLVDYAFSLRGPLSVGQQVIRVENTGVQPHEIALVKLASGKTIDDVLAWIQSPQGPPPIQENKGGVSALASGMEAFFEVVLEPGEYALLCFVTAPNGRSHIHHGMFQQVHVG